MSTTIDDGLGAMAEALDRPNPLRGSGSYEAEIPLSSISPAEWNPKTPIWGTYKRGLTASLGTFSLESRLIVWPDPKRPNVFIALDGNQRLGVIREMIEDHLASVEASHLLGGELFDEGAVFDPTSKDHKKRLETAFKAVKADESFMADARQKASSELVPCRVLADLDLDGAKAFTLAYDRNAAKYDETKVSSLTEELAQRKAEMASRATERREELTAKADAYRKKLEQIVRPERSSFAVPTDLRNPATPSATPEPFVPTAEDPWGPPPPSAEPSPSERPGRPDSPRSGPKPQLIPVMLSLTPAENAKLETGILRAKSRTYRSKQLMEAIERFMSVSPDMDVSDAFEATLLVSLNDRIAIAQAGE